MQVYDTTGAWELDSKKATLFAQCPGDTPEGFSVPKGTVLPSLYVGVLHDKAKNECVFNFVDKRNGPPPPEYRMPQYSV